MGDQSKCIAVLPVSLATIAVVESEEGTFAAGDQHRITPKGKANMLFSLVSNQPIGSFRSVANVLGLINRVKVPSALRLAGTETSEQCYNKGLIADYNRKGLMPRAEASPKTDATSCVPYDVLLVSSFTR